MPKTELRFRRKSDGRLAYSFNLPYERRGSYSRNRCKIQRQFCHWDCLCARTSWTYRAIRRAGARRQEHHDRARQITQS
jgi:hypothetical protein